MSDLRTLVIIPTRNGYHDLARLLWSISIQTKSVDVFVIDSCSDDGTSELAKDSGAIVHVIPVSEFNHGGTRQASIDCNPDYDIYVFLTQDAYLEDQDSINNLLAPFADNTIGAVCGRQLPHRGASLLAEHARFFNYPAISRVKSYQDAPELGIKTPFISNSFAAYRRDAVLEAGGFPNHVILSEDMYIAAKMLLNGWKIAYAADACVRHSHNYTVMEELRRYFDTGVFHARESWIRDEFSQAEGEGKRYVLSELRFLGRRRFYIWPASLIRNAFKLLGYKLGLQERRLPGWLKKKLSMHKKYWDNGHCSNN